MPGYVHHVQWCVSRLNWRICIQKLQHFGFQPIAFREGEVLLKRGETVFLISEHESNLEAAREKGDQGEDSYPYLVCSKDAKDTHVERVFNICLQVDSAEGIHERMVAGGSSELMPPTVIEGGLTYSVVTAPCENVIHVLLSSPQPHTNISLPGFTPLPQEGVSCEAALGSLTQSDHITYVCRQGESQRILQWYRQVCGMQNFPVKRSEREGGVKTRETGDEEFGCEGELYLRGEVGMRLQAGLWLSQWLCREEGLQLPSSPHSKGRNFKLVLAEPLHGHQDSHVQKFLNCNGGPGIQHIGLLTGDIEDCVAKIVENGFQFRHPPPTYYSMEKKRLEFESSGLNLETCRRLGILIDSEYVGDGNASGGDNVLQIFSQPLFPEQDTFFLEVIQRNGSALGFGSGNISALAASIIEFNKLRQSN